MTELRQLHDSLYVGERPFRSLGVEIGARMTVVRLRDGGLWIHSPVEVDEFKAAIDKLGPVRYLVAPNRFHFMDLGGWIKAYPEAKVYAAPKVPSGKDIRIDHHLRGEPVLPWAGQIEYTLFRGSLMATEAVFWHLASRTLILTDTAENISKDSDKVTKTVAKILGILGRFSPTRVYKLALRNRTAARSSLRTMLNWDFDRIIIAHGVIQETGGKQALREAYKFLNL